MEHRAELIVAGRAFLTFHRACFWSREGRRWRIRLGYPINGAAFLLSFLGLNGALVGTALAFGPNDSLRHLAIWLNAGLIVMRGACWFGLERRLPE